MICIRAVEAGDLQSVRELLGQLGYTFTAEEVQSRIGLLQLSRCDPILLATQDGKVVGLIALHFATMLHRKEPVARITALVVQESMRGAGVGRVLVDAGYDLARKSGCSTLELTSGIARTDAHAFYSRLGFTNSSLRFSLLITDSVTPQVRNVPEPGAANQRVIV